MKKSLILIIPLLALLSLVFVSAINLQVDKNIVRDVVVTELSDPAVFSFDITNLGPTDNFEIYSLVGVDISPKGTFVIVGGEKKTIQVEIYPTERFKRRPGIVTFSYNIRGQNSGIQTDTLTMNIVDLKDALDISVGTINPDSEYATISIENKANFNFLQINLKMDSAFFSDTESFTINALQTKEIKIPLDREKMKNLMAGQYTLTSKIQIGEVKQSMESTIKFLEKSGLLTTDKTSGILLRERVIEKTNEGNIPTVAEITMKKDIVSRLFTVFSLEPNKAERNGFIVTYTWMKELKPSEVLSVKSNTNYLYPFLIVLIILIGVVFLKFYISSDLMLTKRVNYVKTKGGEFALKVTIVAKARNFVERISIVDKLPYMAKLYEKFGTYAPSRYSDKTKRIEWDVVNLQPGEERIFSYIFYSKVGVVGKFELPASTAIYEKDGKIKETSSNRAFFMNEPRRKEG